MGLIMLAEEYF